VITGNSPFVAGDHQIELRECPGCRIKVGITDSDIPTRGYPEWLTAKAGTPV
jgi:hypothetical protein